MAYVPGFRHDLFLSYSHDDPKWIEGFVCALRDGVRRRLGSGEDLPDVWKDVLKLRLGSNWPAEIEASIAATAAFVAILSPGYFTSRWCKRERGVFLDRPADALDGSRERTTRFLKIIKSPNDDRKHLDLLPQNQHVAFFDEGDERTGAIEWSPGDDAFRARMRETVHAIATLLRTMRRSRTTIFLATPADDVATGCQEVRDELEAQGFNVRPEGPLDASFTDDAVRRELEPSTLAVVLLGERYDAFVERQLRLAHELEKRLVCWVRPGPAPADSRQHRLLDSLRDGTAQPCTLLERHSSRDLIRELLEALRGQPARAPAPSTGNPRVYLLYDPTTDRDANVVATVRTSIEAERLEVLTPQAGSTLDRQDQHRRLLHDCDAVLLCRGAAPAPDQWLFQTVPDVLFAEQQLSRPPMTSKGLLLANPTSFVGLPNVSVMPLTDAVSPAVLRPFLEPLRHARHG